MCLCSAMKHNNETMDVEIDGRLMDWHIRKERYLQFGIVIKYFEEEFV